MTGVRREIKKDLVSFFDQRLINLAPFVEKNDPTKMLLLAAATCIGVTESGGDNKGPIVELFQSTIGQANGEPWCMAFIQSCIAYVETFNFKSDVFDSEHCLTVFNKSKKVTTPKAGDLIIWQMGNSASGHVGIITSESNTHFTTVEGNTSPSQDIDRNGDGVYLKRRSKLTGDKFKILGFIRVFDN